MLAIVVVKQFAFAERAHILNEHEALGVGDDLGSIQSLLKVVNESLLVTLEFGSWATKDLAGANTLVFDSTETAGEDGFADQGNGHAEIEGVDSSPLSSTLLAGLVENLLNKGSAVIVVVLEDVAGDLNQERVQNSLVPLVEDLANFVGSKTNTAFQDIVRLQVKTN